jgi:hypothetical protein
MRPANPDASIRNIPQEYLEIYRLFRERVAQEDNLVNQRIGWVLWSNAIFFAFFVGITTIISGKSDPSIVARLSVAPIAIALAGIVCTIGLSLGIAAALNEIDYLYDIYFNRYPSIKHAVDDGLMPNLVGHRSNHIVGKIIPWCVPISMGLLWMVLLLFHYLDFRK